MDRRLVTILAMDVVGYSRLMHCDEEATLDDLLACRKIIELHIEEYGGRVFGSSGDSVIAEFSSPVQAARCAIVIQKELLDRATAQSQENQMLFRCGLNLGDVILKDGNLFGEGVNVAARLEAVAEPGGLCISQSAYEQIRGKVEEEFVGLGPQALKNIERPVTAYAWPGNGAATQTKISKQIDPVIAVLPFETFGNDDQAFLADGLSEEIITTISKVPGLIVVSRHSTAGYKGQSVDVRQVKEEQGASHILEGSIRKAGSRIRISSQLVDAGTGHHIWTERYDRELEDIFDLQDDISLNIAKALHGEILEGEMAVERASGTQDLHAWEMHVRATEKMRSVTKETNTAARMMVEKALKFDPKYAAAMSTLALTHGMDARHGFSASRSHSVELMRDWAERALGVDDGNAEAYGVLGFADNLEGDVKSAISRFKQALELNPSHAEVTIRLALSLIFDGRPTEAVGTSERAMRLCPKHPAWYYGVYGFALRSVGRFDEAILAFRNYGAQVEGFGLVDLTIVYMQLDDEQAARKQAAQLLRHRPDFTVQDWAKTQLYSAEDGVRDDIKALLRAGLPE
ncbi:TolB amino-terminal domain-containing protein [Shimia gijangensis]|uniref:TolB amino-terminal domain-containing protein n=1 Tax=Shimia gijangensis TaxID=1470563 RepID=A0A1M6SA11_9RHOB|nr:adenylate/guanylate cyclase domain-containing protein [Shimia gijangensis]SHK41506.1 TolB amino-terminal domain-containing protein [Shimia gijangensis]